MVVLAKATGTRRIVDVDNIDAGLRIQRQSLAVNRREDVTTLPDTSAALGRGRLRWDNPTMVVTLDAKRRLTVPAALAPARPGDHFDADFDVEEDAIIFRRLGGRENWLEVMKECPVSPDDVPPRRREPAKRRKL
ncbi:MAG TPA: hypothetical protein VIX35_10335 [Vicinamibacterales bacterium]